MEGPGTPIKGRGGVFPCFWISSISRLYLWYISYPWLPRILWAHKPLKPHACFHFCSYPVVLGYPHAPSKMPSAPLELAWGQAYKMANSNNNWNLAHKDYYLLFCFFVAAGDAFFGFRCNILVASRPEITLTNQLDGLVSTSIIRLQPMQLPVT